MAHSTISKPNAAEIDDYRWLTGGDAGRLLAMLAASSRALAAQVKQLRQTLSPARTHLLVEQVALRRHARAKFAAADRMFFTPLGLEQATDAIVAEHKARRFEDSPDALDLCTGIGGDLLAMARVTKTVGVDRDPLMKILAEANSQALARPSTVDVGDVATIDAGRCSAWHIDPDRRPSGRRTTRVALHEPGVDVLENLLAQNANGAIKLAPAAVWPESWSERAELEWISRGRECRQLVAWFGDLANAPGRRRATVLGADGSLPRTVVGLPDEHPSSVGKIGNYVFEPDAAVLAAMLGATLAGEHGLAAITPGISYWTSDSPVDDPALSSFEVCEVLPFDLKRVKAALASRSIGTLEIKKRGVDHDPQRLRRQLKPRGDERATLIVTRIAGRVTAIIARRMGSSSLALDGRGPG